MVIVRYIFDYMIKKHHHGAIVRQIIKSDFTKVSEMLQFQYQYPVTALTNEGDDCRRTESTRLLCRKNRSATYIAIQEPYLGVWRDQCAYYTFDGGNYALHYYLIYDDRVHVTYCGSSIE